MRAVLQRVSGASLSIDSQEFSEISKGFVVLLGIEDSDNETDVDWLVRKISAMRVFSDNEGKMNLSLTQVGGRCMVVSQFTLHASTKKGNRPSFIRSAAPDHAKPLYERFIDRISDETATNVATGVFGANMQINLTNDGPVTILLDSKNKE